MSAVPGRTEIDQAKSPRDSWDLRYRPSSGHPESSLDRRTPTRSSGPVPAFDNSRRWREISPAALLRASGPRRGSAPSGPCARHACAGASRGARHGHLVMSHRRIEFQARRLSSSGRSFAKSSWLGQAARAAPKSAPAQLPPLRSAQRRTAGTRRDSRGARSTSDNASGRPAVHWSRPPWHIAHRSQRRTWDWLRVPRREGVRLIAVAVER